MEIVNFKKKDIILLTDDENRYYENENIAIYVKENFGLIKIIKANIKYTRKLGIIVITQGNLELQHRVFVI